jgi:predicted HicB family RNase H-like nuclease
MAVRKQNFDDDDENDQTDNARKRSRITIDISPEMRRRIKIAALQNDLSISEYLGRILEEVVPEETPVKKIEGHPVTREAIERLRLIREQIMQDRQGKPFTEDSTEMLRQAREERTRYLMREE